MSIEPEKEFKKLINDLVTECTRCKCEIRVREMINNALPPYFVRSADFCQGCVTSGCEPACRCIVSRNAEVATRPACTPYHDPSGLGLIKLTRLP